MRLKWVFLWRGKWVCFVTILYVLWEVEKINKAAHSAALSV